ncbi:MAG TPA: hypothetical protein VFK79_13800 [Xanthobacteraceae bacterium]|nr:hypothetical protein [Xanthobacteraceae bacterium]
MIKAEVYRGYAATCRQLSEKAAVEDRALWLKIAKQWLRMADAADRNPDAFDAP